jgi:hypothetical protein
VRVVVGVVGLVFIVAAIAAVLSRKPILRYLRRRYPTPAADTNEKERRHHRRAVLAWLISYRLGIVGLAVIGIMLGILAGQ